MPLEGLVSDETFVLQNNNVEDVSLLLADSGALEHDFFGAADARLVQAMATPRPESSTTPRRRSLRQLQRSTVRHHKQTLSGLEEESEFDNQTTPTPALVDRREVQSPELTPNRDPDTTPVPAHAARRREEEHERQSKVMLDPGDHGQTPRGARASHRARHSTTIPSISAQSPESSSRLKHRKQKPRSKRADRASINKYDEQRRQEPADKLRDQNQHQEVRAVETTGRMTKSTSAAAPSASTANRPISSCPSPPSSRLISYKALSPIAECDGRSDPIRPSQEKDALPQIHEASEAEDCHVKSHPRDPPPTEVEREPPSLYRLPGTEAPETRSRSQTRFGASSETPKRDVEPSIPETNASGNSAQSTTEVRVDSGRISAAPDDRTGRLTKLKDAPESKRRVKDHIGPEALRELSSHESTEVKPAKAIPRTVQPADRRSRTKRAAEFSDMRDMPKKAKRSNDREQPADNGVHDMRRVSKPRETLRDVQPVLTEADGILQPAQVSLPPLVPTAAISYVPGSRTQVSNSMATRTIDNDGTEVTEEKIEDNLARSSPQEIVASYKSVDENQVGVATQRDHEVDEVEDFLARYAKKYTSPADDSEKPQSSIVTNSLAFGSETVKMPSTSKITETTANNKTVTPLEPIMKQQFTSKHTRDRARVETSALSRIVQHSKPKARPTERSANAKKLPSKQSERQNVGEDSALKCSDSLTNQNPSEVITRTQTENSRRTIESHENAHVLTASTSTESSDSVPGALSVPTTVPAPGSLVSNQPIGIDIASKFLAPARQQVSNSAKSDVVNDVDLKVSLAETSALNYREISTSGGVNGHEAVIVIEAQPGMDDFIQRRQMTEANAPHSSEPANFKSNDVITSRTEEPTYTSTDSGNFLKQVEKPPYSITGKRGTKGRSDKRPASRPPNTSAPSRASCTDPNIVSPRPKSRADDMFERKKRDNYLQKGVDLTAHSSRRFKQQSGHQELEYEKEAAKNHPLPKDTRLVNHHLSACERSGADENNQHSSIVHSVVGAPAGGEETIEQGSRSKDFSPERVSSKAVRKTGMLLDARSETARPLSSPIEGSEKRIFSDENNTPTSTKDFADTSSGSLGSALAERIVTFGQKLMDTFGLLGANTDIPNTDASNSESTNRRRDNTRAKPVVKSHGRAKGTADVGANAPTLQRRKPRAIAEKPNDTVPGSFRVPAANHDVAAPADFVRAPITQKRPAEELLDGTDHDELVPEFTEDHRRSKRSKTMASDNFVRVPPDPKAHSGENTGTTVNTPAKRCKGNNRGLLASVKRVRAARRSDIARALPEGNRPDLNNQRADTCGLTIPKAPTFASDRLKQQRASANSHKETDVSRKQTEKDTTSRHGLGTGSVRSGARFPFADKQEQKHGLTKPTVPHSFQFEIDNRLERRREFEEKLKTWEKLASANNNSGPPSKKPLPNFKFIHATQEANLAQLASRRREHVQPTIPLTPHFVTDNRLAERERFEEARREREREAERLREEQKRLREEEEEREYREARKRAVPRAHVVPDWYVDAPKKSAPAR